MIVWIYIFIYLFNILEGVIFSSYLKNVRNLIKYVHDNLITWSIFNYRYMYDLKAKLLILGIIFLFFSLNISLILSNWKKLKIFYVYNWEKRLEIKFHGLSLLTYKRNVDVLIEASQDKRMKIKILIIIHVLQDLHEAVSV